MKFEGKCEGKSKFPNAFGSRGNFEGLRIESLEVKITNKMQIFFVFLFHMFINKIIFPSNFFTLIHFPQFKQHEKNTIKCILPKIFQVPNTP